MKVTYPFLIGEIAKKGIKKKAIAQSIGISSRSLSNKLTGQSHFSLPEAMTIQEEFFPNTPIETLFNADRES